MHHKKSIFNAAENQLNQNGPFADFRSNLDKNVLSIHRQTEILIKEIQEKHLYQTEGINLQDLLSKFTLNIICGNLSSLSKHA